MTITDFVAGEDTPDVIEFSETWNPDFGIGLQGILEASVQVGNDVVIVGSDNATITLLNVQLSSLHADDFFIDF